VETCNILLFLFYHFFCTKHFFYFFILHSFFNNYYNRLTYSIYYFKVSILWLSLWSALCNEVRYIWSEQPRINSPTTFIISRLHIYHISVHLWSGPIIRTLERLPQYSPCKFVSVACKLLWDMKRLMATREETGLAYQAPRKKWSKTIQRKSWSRWKSGSSCMDGKKLLCISEHILHIWKQ
jgi:hypothetical protein